MPGSLQKVVEYATQFDPEFARHVKGASRADIDKFAAAVGRKLPPEYENFLEIFGEGDGGLKIAFDGTTDLRDLLDFYQDYVDSGEFTLPAGCFAIGVDALTEEAICLQDEEAGQPAKVVFCGEGRVRGGYAESLEKLLYRTVTLKLRTAALGQQKLFLGSSEHEFAKCVVTAEHLGFQRAWFSDRFVFCGEKNDELLCVIQYPRQPLSLHFACRDKAIFEGLEELVHREFGLHGNALGES